MEIEVEVKEIINGDLALPPLGQLDNMQSTNNLVNPNSTTNPIENKYYKTISLLILKLFFLLPYILIQIAARPLINQMLHATTWA